MQFSFTVNVETERTEGKFASKDELADQIQEAIESADPGELEGENGGTYEVTSWEVVRA
jgi:hypothetical protein